MSKSPGSMMLRQFRSLFETGTVAGLTDGQLLERFLGGRDEGGEMAFAALVVRHGPMVLGVCRRALADPDDAADAFQATFLVLVKKARSVRVDDSLGRWLYGVSRKVSGRARVVAARGPRGEAGELGSIAADTPDPDRFELLAMLDEELGRLAEPFRSAIVLCDLEGLTHEEAARDLLIPVGTIKSRLARGRKKLRERLERRGLNPSALAIVPVVPPSLAEATARMSWMSSISGGPTAAGLVPASSIVLAREVLRAMTGFKLKLAASAVLSLGVVATGAGVLARGQGAGDGPKVAEAEKTPHVLGEIPPGADIVKRRSIEVLGDRVKLDGKEMSLDALTDSLMPDPGAGAAPPATVRILVASDRKYSEVARVVEAIQAAGIHDIRFNSTGSSVAAKLEEPISLALVDQPLADAIQFIRKYTGLNIILDEGAVRAIMKKPVTLEVHQIKVKEALKLILESVHLTHRIEGEVLIITPSATTRDQFVAGPPEVASSLVPLTARAYRPRRVEELKEVVKPVARDQPSGHSANPDRMIGTDRGGQRTEPPREFAKVSMPAYVVEPPDRISVEVLEALPGRPITGERLVRPDGKVSLGYYGEVDVAGLTTTQVKERVAVHLRDYLSDDNLGLTRIDGKTGKVELVQPARSSKVFVDVVSYNSKVYYVQGDVGVPGRLPVTGNETVLDAINYAGGLVPTAAKGGIRLVRPAPPGSQGEKILEVDLDAIINRGDATTNYQILPNDRLVVSRAPKYEPVVPPASKPEPAITPEVEARLQALEGKLDEIIKALGRPTKP